MAATATATRSALRLFGIGADITYVPRFNQILSRHGTRFMNRSLNIDEINELKQLPSHHHIQYLASRWAIKEALCKSSGLRLLFPELKVHRSSSNTNNTNTSTNVLMDTAMSATTNRAENAQSSSPSQLFRNQSNGSLTFPKFGNERASLSPSDMASSELPSVTHCVYVQ
jgi:phosphopantetheine--protein transferase-like protein